MWRNLLASVLLAAPLMSCAGCGSSNDVWVTCKVLKGGAKYTPPDDQRLRVIFVATELIDASGKAVPSSEQYAAVQNPGDGSFSVPGPEGRGIPPGKYRVAISQSMKSGAIPNPSISPKKKRVAFDRDTDYLNNQFAPETSPILRELKTSTELEIDLDKPTG